MGVRFACHHCGKPLNIKRELAGKRGVCPACSTRFRIPRTDAEHSEPLPKQGAGGDARNRSPAAAATTAAVAEPQPSEGGAASQPADSSRAAGEASRSQPPSSLADEPSATWYVRPPSGGQYGPATSEVLREWVDEGRLAASALVWRDGWPQWRIAREAFPEWIDRLPGAGGANDRAAAPAAGSAPAVERPSEPAGEAAAGDGPTLRGDANVSAVRRQRTSRRVLVIGLLFAISVVLLAILAIILMMR